MTNFKKAALFLGFFFLAVLIRVWKTEIKNPYFPTELVFKITDNKHLKLDVYYPKDRLTKHKTLLYFHGGSWISGGKIKVLERYRNFAVKTLLENNIEVISVDYRLIRHGNSLEDCLEDCISAINFCLENADYLRIDTANFGLWGSSAGAHLAFLSYIFSDNEKIKVIVDDFAPTDIYEMWSVVPEVFRKQISTVFYKLENKNVEKFDSLSKVFSPVNYSEKLKKIPVLISHGTADKIVDFSQSVSLQKKLGENCVFFSYEGLGHGFKKADSTEIKNYAERLINFLTK
ncbi:MAG: alpha/beta hydrolase [Bacteroidales bacterium]|nr:alpha/beta hydrolase [Bacteroidales bacterium]